MKLVRKDTLPEGVTYTDTGCAVAPACLECPLPTCKFDDPAATVARRVTAQHEAIVRLYKSTDWSKIELARFFGVSKRTIYRALANYPKNRGLDEVGMMLDTPGTPVSALRGVYAKRAPFPAIPGSESSGKVVFFR